MNLNCFDFILTTEIRMEEKVEGKDSEQKPNLHRMVHACTKFTVLHIRASCSHDKGFKSDRFDNFSNGKQTNILNTRCRHIQRFMN